MLLGMVIIMVQDSEAKEDTGMKIWEVEEPAAGGAGI